MDLSGALGGLHDDLRKAVEERTLRLLVALLAVGIAVAYADERARSGDFEAERLSAVGTGRPSLSSASTLSTAMSSPSALISVRSAVRRMATSGRWSRAFQ